MENRKREKAPQVPTSYRTQLIGSLGVRVTQPAHQFLPCLRKAVMLIPSPKFLPGGPRAHHPAAEVLIRWKTVRRG